MTAAAALPIFTHAIADAAMMRHSNASANETGTEILSSGKACIRGTGGELQQVVVRACRRATDPIYAFHGNARTPVDLDARQAAEAAAGGSGSAAGGERKGSGVGGGRAHSHARKGSAAVDAARGR